MNIPTVETTNQSRFRNSFELNWINSHFIETKKQNIKKTECFYDSSQIFSRPCLIFYLVFSFSGIAGYIPLQHHKTSLNKTFMYLRPLFSGDVEPTTPISTNTHPKSSPFCTKNWAQKTWQDCSRELSVSSSWSQPNGDSSGIPSGVLLIWKYDPLTSKICWRENHGTSLYYGNSQCHNPAKKEGLIRGEWLLFSPLNQAWFPKQVAFCW